MIKKIIFFAVLILLAACNQPGKFTVSGKIADGEGKVLYFEKNGLVKDSLIDSLKLSKDGSFKFRTQVPRYPELYRLRLNNQQLILGVDSSENVEVQGTANDLIASTISGSKQSEDIQKLRKSVITLQKLFDEANSEKDAARSKVLADSFRVALENHKKETQGLILMNPGSIASYFALYQQIGGNYIFSPYLKEERPYYQAVATTFHTFMPEYDRSKNLYNLVLAAIKEDRMNRRQPGLDSLVSVSSLGFIEIELKNVNGYPQKLSSFVGKPILLDFSAYGTKTSIDYTFALREIYDKYASKGLQIYQVSVDESKMLWERSVSNIPWTCVFDETGYAARTYNIQEIPTLYLINKEGNIIGKYGSVKAMEADLGKVL